MFTGIKLKNFKSLVDFEVKFPRNRKLVIIYGENGVGKSNFIDAFSILRKLVTGRPFDVDDFLELANLKFNHGLSNIDMDAEVITDLFKTSNLKRIIESCKTINSEGENMVLSFDFTLRGKKGSYIIETDDNRLISERLEYVYNKQIVEFFNVNNDEIHLNEKVIKNKEYYEELINNCEKYWGKNTLTSMIFKDIQSKNDKYMSKSLTKNMTEIIDYFSSLNISVSGQILFPGLHLGEGITQMSNQAELDKNEKILDDIFTRLYPDIKQVYYKKEIIDDGKINYKLYFKKLVGNKILDIDIERESKGTKQVLNITKQILYGLDKQVLIIDEFDTGIHDILAKSMLQSLYDSLDMQIIITTHNTLLIEAKDLCKNAYVLTHNIDGSKDMIAISDFEKRIHSNLNIRDRYLRGMYGGVPIPLDIDFSDYKDADQEDC